MSKEKTRKHVKLFVLNQIIKTLGLAGVLIMSLCLQYSIASTFKKENIKSHPLFITIDNVISIRVVDAKGIAIPGVVVKVKGTTTGNVTDADGICNIDIKTSNAILIVSMIGYLTQEVAVEGKTKLVVVLQETTTGLNDVVVVGYGKQSTAKVTGAISSVKGSELLKAPVANITNSLAGRLPGLIAVQRSGEPGQDASSINIRGFGDALIIVDGVPASFSELDANEIESISVLKDASAAVYGVRAANGVVMVTTKKGTIGKPTISYNAYYAMQQVTNYPKLLDALQFAELRNEAAVNAWVRAGNLNAPLNLEYSAQEIENIRNGTTPNTDWYSSTIRDISPQFYQNLGVSGGTEDVKYYVNLGYVNQGGLWHSGDTKYQRYNLRSSINAKITKRLTADLNLSGRYEDRQYPGESAASIISAVKRIYPIYPVYANNNPAYYSTSNANNAVQLTDKNESGNSTYLTKYFSGIFSLNYALPYIEGLNLKGLVSYQNEADNTKYYSKQRSLYTYDATTGIYNAVYKSSISSVNQGNNQQNTLLTQLSLNYAASFNKHNVSGLLLFERQNSDLTALSAYRQFTLQGIQQLDFGDVANQSNSGNLTEQANMGYVGKFNYDYAGKYLLEFGFRYDGTYRASPDKRFGFFPNVSVGWRISEENFMKNITVIDNLKLRASYGKVGDDQGLAAFQYLQGYNLGGNYLFGADPTLGIVPSVLSNPNATWFTSKTSNIGLDISLWKGLLGATIEGFYRERAGLFATRVLSLPNTFGANLPQENLNGDNTRGFELTLTHKNKIGNLDYSISPNVSFTKSRNAYIERAESTNSYLNWRNNTTGRNKNIFWGYVATGQFQSQSEINTAPIQDSRGNQTLLPGDIRYADLNGDGIINSSDQTIIGRGTTPEMFFGLNLAAQYRGFDLSVLLQGASNFNAYYDGELQNPFFNNANSYTFFADRWHRTVINDPNSAWIPGKFPSTVLSGSDNNKLTSSFWLQNATYLRVKNVDFGYTFSKNLLGKSGVQRLRVYFSGQNIFTFSKLKNINLDPEAPGGRGDYYPQMKIWTFGLNVGL
ncbi:SusC/RagA family TonB-linked outer membrane protein [Pedobacter chinensis]|nr:TonB-dependent receptor [Pedobacter chinensis]